MSAVDEVPDINRLRSRRPYALMFEIDTFARWKMWFVFAISLLRSNIAESQRAAYPPNRYVPAPDNFGEYIARQQF